jgi:hypothetical protein
MIFLSIGRLSSFQRLKHQIHGVWSVHLPDPLCYGLHNLQVIQYILRLTLEDVTRVCRRCGGGIGSYIP